MKPQRIQLRRTKGWKMPASTVKVDRSTPYGNPYRVQAGHETKAGVRSPKFFTVGSGIFDAEIFGTFDTKVEAVRRSVECFRAYVEHPANSKLRAAIALLAGKDLGCWCPPGQPCHVDVLLEIANP